MAGSRDTRRASPQGKRKAQSKTVSAGDIPPLEWAAAGVGLVLAASAIGLTAWDAMFGVKGPPAIEVRLQKVTATGYGYVAEIEAFNHGGAPAAQVQIEGVIAGGDTAGVTIDYIPEQSRASGGLIFSQDPRGGRLTLRAKGYTDAS